MFKEKVPMLLLRNLDVVEFEDLKSLIQDCVPGSNRVQNDFNAARIIFMVNMKI